MTIPLVLIDGDDVQLFKSVSDLENYVEARDVLAGAYEAFDGDGRALRLSVDNQRVSVELAEKEPRHSERLSAALFTALQRGGLEPAADDSLAALLAKATPLCAPVPRGHSDALKRLLGWDRK